jgi:hypothetical protein
MKSATYVRSKIMLRTMCCVIPAGCLLFRHNITRFSPQHENLAGTSDEPGIFELAAEAA